LNLFNSKLLLAIYKLIKEKQCYFISKLLSINEML